MNTAAATLDRDVEAACKFSADHIDKTLAVFDRFLKVTKETQDPRVWRFWDLTTRSQGSET